ncbi:MAG: hypothetical protein ACRELB_10020 [Polyangiaceae bacterium]
MTLTEARRSLDAALDAWVRRPDAAAAFEAFVMAGSYRLHGGEPATEARLRDERAWRLAVEGLDSIAAAVAFDIASARRAHAEGADDRAADLARRALRGRHRAELAWGAIARCAPRELADPLHAVAERLLAIDADLRHGTALLADAADALTELRRDLGARDHQAIEDRLVRLRFWWAFHEAPAYTERSRLPRMAAAPTQRLVRRLKTRGGTAADVSFVRGEPIAIEFGGDPPPAGCRVEAWAGEECIGSCPIDGPFLTIAPSRQVDSLDSLSFRIVHALGGVEELAP